MPSSLCSEVKLICKLKVFRWAICHLLNEALSGFDDDVISFVYKYVDDLLGGVDANYLLEIQKAIEDAHGMTLKMCWENDANEVDNLQMRIKRPADNDDLDIRWMQKDYSSKCILNFHSFHPWNMKVNVVMEYVRSAFALSSRAHWMTTADLLRETLRNSCYPNRFVNDKVASGFCEDKPRPGRYRVGRKTKVGIGKFFLACPYYPPDWLRHP